MSEDLLLLALYPDRPQLDGKAEFDHAVECPGHLNEVLVGSPPWFVSAVPSRKLFWPTIYKKSFLIRKMAIKGFQSKKTGIFPLQPHDF